MPAEPPRESAVPPIPFDLVPVQPRRDGWTAERQRGFIQALAECGVASRAAAAVGMSERSAHRLALRPDAASFANAWDWALQVAVRRGASLLFEYALEGMVETVWRDGEIAWQRRRPSEKALFFLLSRLDPARFARPPAPDPALSDHDPLKVAVADFSMAFDNLEDLPDEPEEEEEEAAAESERDGAPEDGSDGPRHHG